MKKLTYTLLFIVICTVQHLHAQTEPMHIVFQKQEKPQYSSIYFLEVKDVSQFKIPKGIENFVIGYQHISFYHHLYNNRLTDEATLAKYYAIVEEENIDTLQFTYNNLKKTVLHTLFYMQDGIKHCILDTDFDHSFLNEEVFRFEQDETTGNYPHFFTNLKVPVDSLSYSTTKLIPVGIKNSTNSSTGNDIIADSLQVDIFPNFSYQSHFIDDGDTILMYFSMQDFDLFYLKQDIAI